MSGNGNHREAAVKRYSKKSNEVALSVQDTRSVFSTLSENYQRVRFSTEPHFGMGGMETW